MTSTKHSAFALRCPSCGHSLDRQDQYACACGFVFHAIGGILRGLVPDREQYFARFRQEYGEIRAREGRGTNDDAYYLALPFEDRTGRNAWQWSIRARSFRYLESQILLQIERRVSRGLNVLDIGAGNGWLSYRLSLRGHCCAAVDLLDNSWDGLGATSHYLPKLPKPFTVVQAEMDHLPFADAQFDVAIFNASFHYSTDYEATLRETLRCLRPDGDVLILDTPFYEKNESGIAMIRERQAQFEKQYGFKSDSIASSEYVTGETLAQLARECGVRWDIRRPWYGWNWALRPWKARLKRRREPSKFYVLWGRPQS